MSGVPTIDLDDLPPALLVYGNEPYFRTRYLAQLRNNLREIAEIDDVWCDDTTKSARVEMVLDQNMAWGGDDQPHVVFVWDFQKIKDRDKKLLPYLHNPSRDTMAVFVLSEGSQAGGSLIKKLKSGLCFKSPRLEVDKFDKFDNVAPWVQAHFKLHGFLASDYVCQEFHTRLGKPFGNGRVQSADLFSLESEMRRVMAFLGQRRDVYIEDLDAVIETRTQTDPFALTDALLRLNVKRSMNVIHDLFTGQRKNPSTISIGILGALFKAFQRWFQVLSMRGRGKWDFDRIAKSLGLPVFVVEKKIWPFAKKHKMRTLLKLQSRVCRVDYLIKRGACDGQTQIELIVLEACGLLERSLPVYPV